MAEIRNYLDRLKAYVEEVQMCSAAFLETEHIKGPVNGETIWEGDVEVFWINSPTTRAKRCYGWLRGESDEFVTVLGLPPVNCALEAVRAAYGSAEETPLRGQEYLHSRFPGGLLEGHPMSSE